MTDPNLFLQALEELTPMVEILTGLKAKFVDAGWTSLNAERAALELYSLVARMQTPT